MKVSSMRLGFESYIYIGYIRVAIIVTNWGKTELVTNITSPTYHGKHVTKHVDFNLKILDLSQLHDV